MDGQDPDGMVSKCIVVPIGVQAEVLRCQKERERANFSFLNMCIFRVFENFEKYEAGKNLVQLGMF